jgi:hypothetical protein
VVQVGTLQRDLHKTHYNQIEERLLKAEREKQHIRGTSTDALDKISALS